MNSELALKIQKLLALSESSNVNEASLALAKARELMHRHNLAMSDLEWAEEVDKDPIRKFSLFGNDVYGERKQRRDTFGTSLLGLIAAHNNCKSYGWVGSNGHTIVGTQKDVDMTINMFKLIYPMIQTECDVQYSREYQRLPRSDRWRMKNWKRSFRSGVYWRLQDRFQEMKESLQKEYAGTMALVRLDTLQKVEQWADENIETVRTYDYRKAGWNKEGAEAGKQFGNRVPINKELK